MVYYGVQLVSTIVPEVEVAELMPPQTDWSVRDQKAFYVECRICLQFFQRALQRNAGIVYTWLLGYLAVDCWHAWSRLDGLQACERCA